MSALSTIREEQKYIPPEMADYYFPFSWDLEKLWSLKVATSYRKRNTLDWHLDIPIWSSVRGQMLFDLRPRTVMNESRKHPRHWLRIEKAATAYPIDLMSSGGKLVILDGVHRLVKHYLRGNREIPVRVIPREMITFFAE